MTEKGLSLGTDQKIIYAIFKYCLTRKGVSFMECSKGFGSSLRIEDIGTCGGKTIYRLEAPLVFYGCNSLSITVPAGFETDFASVPRLPIAYMAWGDRAHREAVLHDYLYSIGAEPDLPRGECDKLFRYAMILRGNPWWIYQSMYWGVRIGGSAGFKKAPVDFKFKIDAV